MAKGEGVENVAGEGRGCCFVQAGHVYESEWASSDGCGGVLSDPA